MKGLDAVSFCPAMCPLLQSRDEEIKELRLELAWADRTASEPAVDPAERRRP